MNIPYNALDKLRKIHYIGITMENHEFRAIRKRLGLTQAQLATVLEWSHPVQVSEIERETNPKSIPKHVALLMRAYDEGYRPKNWPD
jgi:DNA-binding transcriptional regulator YiaG